MTGKRSARDSARWRQPGHVWLDHVNLADDDLEWLGDVVQLTAWAVKHPPDLLGRLSRLEWLDVRGGTGRSADFLAGCTRLHYLQLNQIRGLSDLTAIEGLDSLELLSLYGLPQVRALPDLSALPHLRRLELGSMKGLNGIEPALRCAQLEELLLIRAVSLGAHDAEVIRDHPGLREFDWFAEDVPLRVWQPVAAVIDKPKARPLHPEEWFAARR